MEIRHWVPPMIPSTTRPSQELKEDPVLYTLVTLVETGVAFVPVLLDGDDAGLAVELDAGFAGLQPRRMWPG